MGDVGLAAGVAVEFDRAVGIAGAGLYRECLAVVEVQANGDNKIYAETRRQMRDDSATASEETAVAPYFITSQNANAGRYASGNDATEAYYWRYMPGLANENVKPTVAPDWSVPFEVPASFANNSMFEFDGQEVYGSLILA